MARHYSGGTGKLYSKESSEIIAEIKYQIIWTDRTKYTRSIWWGEFSTVREIRRLGNYIIELENGRKGECVISNTQGRRLLSQYYYRLNGRSPLGYIRQSRKKETVDH